jgi:hypothetical protein
MLSDQPFSALDDRRLLIPAPNGDGPDEDATFLDRKNPTRLLPSGAFVPTWRSDDRLNASANVRRQRS